MIAQQVQVRSGGMPSLRSSHDGRVDNLVPSLRGSFDSASLRATAPAVPIASNAMSNLGGAPMTAGGTPTRGNVDGDTNRVLAELERVRTGIQATLAAAAAQGKMGGTTPRHPPPPTAGPPPSSYLQGVPNGVPVIPIHVGLVDSLDLCGEYVLPMPHRSGLRFSTHIL